MRTLTRVKSFWVQLGGAAASVPGVGGALLHLLVGLVQGRLTPHLGLDRRLVVVGARVVQVPQAVQGLRRRGPAVRRGPRGEALVRRGHGGEGGGAGNLGVV